MSITGVQRNPNLRVRLLLKAAVAVYHICMVSPNSGDESDTKQQVVLTYDGHLVFSCAN